MRDNGKDYELVEAVWLKFESKSGEPIEIKFKPGFAAISVEGSWIILLFGTDDFSFTRIGN